MLPQTARYLDLARTGRNEWWRYLLGTITIAFFWLVLGYLPYFALLVGGAEPGPLAQFALLNFSIIMMLAGLALAVKLFHRRPLLSLVAPDLRIDWRRMGSAAGVWAALAAVTALLEHLAFPGRYYVSLDPAPFAAFLAAVMVLTPVQCAAEELVFRGYALQGFSLLTRRPIVLAVASSLLFTAPHLLNPEAHQHGLLIMGANYFAIGMVLATVTLRDGRLELAIGLHAANNVFLALVANYDGSALMTESIFTAVELDPLYSLVTLVAGGALFHWWIFRRPRMPAPETHRRA